MAANKVALTLNFANVTVIGNFYSQILMNPKGGWHSIGVAVSRFGSVG